MKIQSLVYSLMLFLVLTACSNVTVPVEDTPEPVEVIDAFEFEFVPDGLPLNGTNTPKMIVRLAIVKENTTNHRKGRVVVRWSDQAGSRLTGSLSVKLRSTGGTPALAELKNAAIDSAPSAPTTLETATTLQTVPLCVEVTAWNLRAGSYTFNTQSLPLVFCQPNSTETGSDLAVGLDASSQTRVGLNRTFPFVIATQNLGKQHASNVVVTVALPSELEFMSENSPAYDCTATTVTAITCTLNTPMPVSRLELPLMLKGETLTTSTNVSVSISATSNDPNSDNNSFTQAIAIIPFAQLCGADLFPDAELRNAVKTQLSIANDDDLCIENVGGLTVLNASASDISNLSGLEYATDLKELYLLDNQISDISALSGLTHLTTLNLLENQISDISSLAGLTNLTQLDLYANQISDILALSGMTNLTTLYLNGNKISDVSALSRLTNLRELDLFENEISSISSLARLINLTTLVLKSNQISDISSLSGLTNLTTLYLDDNQISDVSALVNNSGLDSGDLVTLESNPLGSHSQAYSNIATLQARGVYVFY